MKIAELIKKGPLDYVHVYNQTSTNYSTAEHTLDVPKSLETLAKNTPQAVVVEFGDASLGIEIDNKLWAAEIPHAEMRPAKSLPHEVWQYINLALDRKIGGVRLGDTHAR